jgi:hypothetical protein
MNNIQNLYQIKLFIWFLRVKQKTSYVVSFTQSKAINSNLFFNYLEVMA